jgi:protein-L-isoaspartate O-methyltransferase
VSVWPPLPASDPVRLYRYRDGLYAVDLLTAAIVHFDVFSWLAEHPSPLGAICDHYGTAVRPTDVLLTLATALGIVERRGEAYGVTPLGRDFLTSPSPYNLTPYYASLEDRPIVQDFIRVLRTDRPAHWAGTRDGHDWHASMEQEAFAQTFTRAMDCRGVYLAQALAGALDLGGHARVLDIGGGSGVYACALVDRFAHLRATVFEQAPVDRVAARRIAERGFADRVAVGSGDFFRDDWPAGHDVHLFSNVLHDWGADDVERLIARSAKTIAPGGRIVIHEAFINADKTGPLPVAEYSAILMHSTQGKCYATSEYQAWLTAHGFSDARFVETAVDRGVMTAVRT